MGEVGRGHRLALPWAAVHEPLLWAKAHSRTARGGHRPRLADEETEAQSQDCITGACHPHPKPPNNRAGVCHAAAPRGSPGPETEIPCPTQQRPTRGGARCGARSPGRGSEASVPATQTPGARPPAGWRAPAGRLRQAAQTRPDGTRAAPPHLSPTAFPGAPPGIGVEELPKKLVRRRPLPAAAGCCRSQRRWPQSQS